MAKNTSNIISTPFDMYIADSTTELPISSTVNGTLDFDNWTSVGYTEGVTVSWEVKHQDIKVDGELCKIKMIPTEESAELTVKLSERDLETLSYASATLGFSNVPADTSNIGFDIVGFGGGTNTDYAIVFHGRTNPYGDNWRLWHFPICIATGKIKYESNNEHSPVEVTFSVLNNPEEDAGAKLFKFYDMTGPHT